MNKELNLKYDEKGLIPAIVQDYHTRQVLMLGYMNAESLEKTQATGKATFFSRSRQKLWTKGETSGHFLDVVSIDFDCDEDTLLIQAIPAGPTCHTGNTSCFYRTLYENETLNNGNITIMHELEKQVQDRRENPIEGSYTNYLLREGIDKICKKIGEESAETIIAAKNADPSELIYESSDLLYHLTVLLNNQGVTYDQLFKELVQRHLNSRKREY